MTWEIKFSDTHKKNNNNKFRGLFLYVQHTCFGMTVTEKNLFDIPSEGQ